MQSFGKTTPLEDPKEGRSFKEFSKKKIDPQTTVKVNENGMAVISKINMIAADAINYNLKKMYRSNGDGSYSFFYSFNGDFNNSTMTEINLIADLLSSSFQNDYQSVFADYEPTLIKTLDVKISFEKQVIYLYFVMKFEKNWEPGDKFEEVH